MRRQGSVVASSAGMVFGKAQKLDDKHLIIKEYKIIAADIPEELVRFKGAIKQASDELQVEMDKLAGHHQVADLLPILEVQQMMLNDPELLVSSEQLIKTECINAEWALKKCIQDITSVFDNIQDGYLRSRREDIEHVGQRISNYLSQGEQLEKDNQSIMVAINFSPAEIISMWRSGVPGFVSVQGGEDSHAMIVARGVGLPGLAGTQELFDLVEDGASLILNAEKGFWILNPDEADFEHYKHFQQDLDEEAKKLQCYVNMPSKSEDGYELPLMANLEFVEEVEIANKYGADGVGLFRTEYLFMQAEVMPSEDEQYKYYAQVVQEMKGKPVTFRLLDLGADKFTGSGEFSDIYEGENPALGLRGVRLLLHKPELLKTQLRAIVRASLFSQVSVLVPMVSLVSEMLEVRKVLDLVKQELGIRQTVQLGCMIEVPAAALIACELADVSDFFSIGSNDLLQYSLAVDRADKQVSYLYDSNHSAILKLIELAVNGALKKGIAVTVCGELAANPGWTQSFLNLKVSGLSMTARSILPIRKQLHHLQAI